MVKIQINIWLLYREFGIHMKKRWTIFLLEKCSDALKLIRSDSLVWFHISNYRPVKYALYEIKQTIYQIPMKNDLFLTGQFFSFSSMPMRTSSFYHIILYEILNQFEICMVFTSAESTLLIEYSKWTTVNHNVPNI